MWGLRLQVTARGLDKLCFYHLPRVCLLFLFLSGWPRVCVYCVLLWRTPTGPSVLTG